MAGVLFWRRCSPTRPANTGGLLEDVCQEFGLDEEQYGVLLSSFRWAYALMQVPAG